MENTLGFAFPLKGASGSVYIEFTRVFYGVGLVVAGFVSDKNRRSGAICCLAALAFPFGALALGSNMAGETVMWMLAYLFLGFWSVYRILVFSDISGKAGIPALAVFGLLFGRLGEAAGTLGAGLFTGTPLIVISGAVFVAVIALFFRAVSEALHLCRHPGGAGTETLCGVFRAIWLLCAGAGDIRAHHTRDVKRRDSRDALYHRKHGEIPYRQYVQKERFYAPQ
jgi:hypothetical protein